MRIHISIARWIEEHPVAMNAIVVSALAFMTVWVGTMPMPSASSVLAGALIALPVYLRITWPALAAVLVAAGAVIAVPVMGTWPVGVGIWAVPMVIYRVAATCSRRVRLGVLGLALALTAIFNLSSPRWAGQNFVQAGPADTGIDWWVTIMIFTPVWLVIATSYLLGDVKRSKLERQEAESQRAQALAERAEALAAWAHRLEVEREQEVRIAAQDERTRIAREMHDVIAHSLSVVITQADGARYAAQENPRAATDSLERISATARGSLAEMRRLLGVLRTGEEHQKAPVPTASDLSDLVRSVRQAGLPVELVLNDAGDALTMLSPGPSLAIYRLVQEALTNALKHAPGATAATVEVRSAPDWVEVAVLNDGLLARDGRTVIPSSGHGLRGLAERMSIYGGQVQAGPLPGNPDRWMVRGWVPTGSASETTADSDTRPPQGARYESSTGRTP